MTRVLAQVSALRDAAVGYADSHADHIARADSAWTRSAENLLHYLSLRTRDLRDLQDRLSDMGLSSLGRCESHVLENLESVVRMLQAAAGPRRATRRSRAAGRATARPGLTISQGNHLIARHAEDLLGPAPDARGGARRVRVLVTMPATAADDPHLVPRLLDAGMDCARINCAHDDQDVWARIIRRVRRESKRRGRICRVLMDLAGPKVRVGPLPPGPRVLKVRPLRDELGRVTRPVLLGLCYAPPDRLGNASLPDDCDVQLPLDARPGELRVTPDSFIRFVDARGSRRRMLVRDVHPGGIVAQIERTAYILAGTRLRVPSGAQETIVRVGQLPELPGAVLLRPHDLLRMTDDPAAQVGQALDASDRRASRSVPIPAATITCLPPRVLATVQVGDPVLFDDGKIEGVARRVRRMGEHTEVLVDITRARAAGDRLRTDKGVNLPGTSLPVHSITEDDAAALQFIAAHADVVAQSFVRTASDVLDLHARLAEAGADQLGVVTKIETRQAFANLPSIILAGMQRPRFGVMIARGDLAVEVGYERLAEVQEEILWLCEAGHVPVIWATQVLEGLASAGRPSRAEITDAAMAERAECVMLNKGPYITDAVRVLDDILSRMHEHQKKKVPRLRRLAVAQTLDRQGPA